MLLLKRRLKKYHFFRLIIWRSQVQALAGPQENETLIARNQAASVFLLQVCKSIDYFF